MEPHTYTCGREAASPDHRACEERIRFLAQGAAELIEYYEGVIFTLRRQLDAAQTENRQLRRRLSTLLEVVL